MSARAALVALAACLGCSHAPGAECRASSTDPGNCGACGHDCAGGACSDGGCVPLEPGVLATGQSRPGAIALDDANVYWATSDSDKEDTISKCAKTGCQNRPTLIAQGTWGAPANLVVRGGYIYWGGESGVHKCPTTGCGSSPAVESSPLGGVGEVALDDNGNVYFVSNGQLFQSTGELDRRADVSLFPLGSVLGIWWVTATIAIDGSTLYALDSQDEVAACTVGDCAATTVALAVPNAFSLVPLLAIDAQNVYVAVAGSSATDGSIRSAAKWAPSVGGNVAEDVATLVAGLSTPSALALDNTTIYFADLGEPTISGVRPLGAGRIGKCPIAGCDGTAQTVKDYLSDPRAIAVDGTNVYFTEQYLGSGKSNDGRVALFAK